MGRREMMRLVSWNCNGKFREKFKQLLSLDADIFVIQECENPNTCTDSAYKDFSQNNIWTGEKGNKGLGIFIKSGISFVENTWPKYGLRNFISIKINSEFDLIGVWACKPYIEEYCIYQNINYDSFDEKSIILGDFNSNSIWDNQHGLRSHSMVVTSLEKKDLFSAYHFTKNEEQGSESQKTFYLHRHPDKGYHIDYCFIAPQRITGFSILDEESWLEYSDHVPIIIDVK